MIVKIFNQLFLHVGGGSIIELSLCHTFNQRFDHHVQHLNVDSGINPATLWIENGSYCSWPPEPPETNFKCITMAIFLVLAQSCIIPCIHLLVLVDGPGLSKQFNQATQILSGMDITLSRSCVLRLIVSSSAMASFDLLPLQHLTTQNVPFSWLQLTYPHQRPLILTLNTENLTPVKKLTIFKLTYCLTVLQVQFQVENCHINALNTVEMEISKCMPCSIMLCPLPFMAY